MLDNCAKIYQAVPADKINKENSYIEAQSCQKLAHAKAFLHGDPVDCSHPEGFLQRTFESKIELDAWDQNDKPGERPPGSSHCKAHFSAVDSLVRFAFGAFVTTQTTFAAPGCLKDAVIKPTTRDVSFHKGYQEAVLKRCNTKAVSSSAIALCAENGKIRSYSLTRRMSIMDAREPRSSNVNEYPHHQVVPGSSHWSTPIPGHLKAPIQSFEDSEAYFACNGHHITLPQSYQFDDPAMNWEAKAINATYKATSYVGGILGLKDVKNIEWLKKVCMKHKRKVQEGNQGSCRVHTDAATAEACRSCCMRNKGKGPFNCKRNKDYAFLNLPVAVKTKQIPNSKPESFGTTLADCVTGCTTETVAIAMRPNYNYQLASHAFQSWKALFKGILDGLMRPLGKQMCPSRNEKKSFILPLTSSEEGKTNQFCCQEWGAAVFKLDVLKQNLKTAAKQGLPFVAKPPGNQPSIEKLKSYNLDQKVEYLGKTCSEANRVYDHYTRSCKLPKGFQKRIVSLAKKREWGKIGAEVKKLFAKLKTDHGCLQKVVTAVLGTSRTFSPCLCTLFFGAMFDNRFMVEVEGVERLSETSLITPCKASTVRSFTQSCHQRAGGLRFTFVKVLRSAEAEKDLAKLHFKSMKTHIPDYQEQSRKIKSQDIVACRMRLSMEQRVCQRADPFRKFDYSCDCDAKQSRAMRTEMVPVRFRGKPGSKGERDFKKAQKDAKCPHWFISWDNAARSIYTVVTTAKYNQLFAGCSN